MELDIDFSSGPAAHRYFLLDVFTDKPLAGNQLAVFTDGGAFGAPTMQRIARELALPETVFLFEPERGGEARARIFTPQVELPFAGHPTLGSTWLIATSRGLDHVRLETGAGIVPVAFERAGATLRFGWMEQPLPTIAGYDGDQAELLGALGAARSLLPIETYTNGPAHVLVMLESAEAVAALTPDFARVAALGDIAVNCFAARPGGFKTRMFAPALGVIEDPATGSAAGPIALHLARHGQIAFGAEIEIEQGVEIGRPALLHARVDGSAQTLERVAVGGSAVIVARAEFRL
jgi:trans-2,3-dihydro-3-hydroxyanthranilate isomerase